MNPAIPTTPTSTSRSPGIFAAIRDTTFRSLKHRDYRLYFFGQIVSFTGSWIQNAALMWWVFDQTGSPIWPPLLLVAQVGPTLLLGTFGGTLADRSRKRQLILRTQMLFLGNAALLTVLIASGWADPWMILVLQCANGLVQAVDLPARLAFVPDLVPRQDLINAISLNSLLFNTARAIGPAVAGMIFLAAEGLSDTFPGTRPVTLGAGACFALNTLSYAAVLLALSRISVPGVGPGKVGNGSPLEGIRYVLARPVLTAVLLLTGAMSVFGWPVMSLFPAYTRLVLGLGVEDYSLLVSSLGGGALVGALVTATFGNEARRGVIFCVGSGLATVGVIGLATAPGLNSAILAAICVGIGLILFLSTGQSTMQLSAGDSARGRVMALWAMTLSGSAPLGHLLAGVAATRFGIMPVLAIMAVGTAVATAIVLAITLLRGWTVTEPIAEAGTEGMKE